MTPKRWLSQRNEPKTDVETHPDRQRAAFKKETTEVSACARRFESVAAVISSLFKVQGHELGSHARSYLCSLLSHASLKNQERFAEEFGGIDYENLQQFISDSPGIAAR